MIRCPECGQEASDGAKFCDRCGQGLSQVAIHSATVLLTPLEPGTELKGGYKIVSLIGQNVNENRYQAERQAGNACERLQLREQSRQAPVFAEEPVQPQPQPEEDPAGPRAKTAELRLKPTKTDQNGAAEASHPPTVESADPTQDDQPVRESAEQPENAPSDTANPSPDERTESGDAGMQTVVLSEEVDAGVVPADEPAVPQELYANGQSTGADDESPAEHPKADDLGEVFGRVLALSTTLKHRAFQRAIHGFADRGRVYLVLADEAVTPLSARSLPMNEPEALNVAIQVCQAVSFAHRLGLRINDICPDSVVYSADGQIKLIGLDYISNDNELQPEPIFNDGYTAPEIYRARRVDKRADVFSIGALLYTCLTAERLESETWREEGGPVQFYPPHVVTPALEQAVRKALLFDPAARWPRVEAFKAELMKLAGAVHIRSAGLTDVGMVREHNEDSVMVVEYQRDSLIEPARNFLYLVADGMGGAEAGEVASAIAVGAVRNYVEEKLAEPGTADVSTILQQALEHANRKIVEYQAAHPEARGMGSTAVALLLKPPEAAVAWIGDSRAYICDSNGLRQLTHDHSLVQRLIEIGQITPEEALHHEHKNVITRSLGARPSGPAGAEAVNVRVKRGDRLMLCSDGLTTYVGDRQIGEILRRHIDPLVAARELMVAANAGGGTDNVSVVVVLAA
jgi:serine/threonine protein phosphatase PrpC